MKLAIFDLDGVLVRGNAVIPGAPETIAKLLDRGVLVRYCTNNSTKTRASHALKLRNLGFEAPDAWLYHSPLAAVRLLHGVKTAYAVGETGVLDALEEANISVTDESPEAVVVGLDRQFTYDKLATAMRCLQNPATRFVATNLDSSFPREGGSLTPGAGSIVAAIATASGRTPAVAGKPEPTLMNAILEETGIEAKDALMVGDRIDTDLEAGRRAGCPVWLVLSGVQPEPVDGIPYSLDVTGLV